MRTYIIKEMREKMQRNAKASIAVLLLSSFALAITIPFLYNKPAPPLGKYIHITFTCSSTGNPIVGLPVTIGTATETTDAQGCVVFGSGYPPGTYIYTFHWWDGDHSQAVTIDCTKKDWYYTESLVNPEVHKYFTLDTPYGDNPPVQGLDVTLVGYGTQTTDAEGYVEWILDYPFGDYQLEWVWNSQSFVEGVYWKDFVNGVWSKENFLDPKSGGGI